MASVQEAIEEFIESRGEETGEWRGEVRQDPTNTGGGLRLAGFLNRGRGPSYRRSQAGRDV